MVTRIMAKKGRQESQSTALRRRRALVRKLYFQRYSPPEIADILMEGGEYGGNATGCLRFVQREVKAIREEASPEAIVATQRPAEIHRYKKNLERLFQIACSRAEDFDVVPREVASPKGDVVTVLTERTPPQSRDRNLKLAADFNERLAKLDNLVSAKGQGIDLPTGVEAGETEKPAFIQFSGKPQEYLIAENLGAKDVN